VNRKIGAAFGSALTPIVCIGETLDQRERNETLDVLDRQIKGGLDGVTSERLARLVLAYEPVWAIGTGRNATPGQAGEAHNHIASDCASGSESRPLTGAGSSTAAASNPRTLAISWPQPDVDGALVGGASLDVQAFFSIVLRSRPAPV
jgi:triosephosphate isomerase